MITDCSIIYLQIEAQRVMDKLSSPDIPESSDVDSHLDRIIIRFSEEMLDDFPASDPRWAETHQSGNVYVCAHKNSLSYKAFYARL